MKTLLSTTAMLVALGFPALALAQTTTQSNTDETTTAASDTETQQQGAEMSGSGFLAERSPSDLFASELMGHDVHARRADDEDNATSDQAAKNADGTHDMATMDRADLDEMENIGQIKEIVLSDDGQVRALVIGVGGFLGMGEQDVAVTMDQVTFASDADDRSEMYIVVNAGKDMLKDAPAYDLTVARTDAAEGEDETDRTAAKTDSAEGEDETDRAASESDGSEAIEETESAAAGTDAAEAKDDTDLAAAGTDAADGNDGTRTDREAFAAPDVEREGFDRVDVRNVSTEMLMGESVYDVNDNDVGSVTDMIIDDDGKITSVIIDFGGFLGIGSSQAALQFKELTVLTTEGYEDVRVYVDATKEQIQELPRYVAEN